MQESNPTPKNLHCTVHSTADQFQNLTPQKFERGLAPRRCSGVSGASRLGRLGDSANPAVGPDHCLDGARHMTAARSVQRLRPAASAGPGPTLRLSESQSMALGASVPPRRRVPSAREARAIAPRRCIAPRGRTILRLARASRGPSRSHLGVPGPRLRRNLRVPPAQPAPCLARTFSGGSAGTGLSPLARGLWPCPHPRSVGPVARPALSMAALARTLGVAGLAQGRSSPLLAPASPTAGAGPPIESDPFPHRAASGRPARPCAPDRRRFLFPRAALCVPTLAPASALHTPHARAYKNEPTCPAEQFSSLRLCGSTFSQTLEILWCR